MATTALSAEYNASVSTVQPIVRSLITNHLKINDDDSPPVADFKQATSSDLERRFCSPDALTGVQMMATILDVRFKGLTFLDAESRESAYDAVRGILSPPELEAGPQVADEQQAKRPRQEASALDFLLGKPGDETAATYAVDAMTTCKQEFTDYVRLQYIAGNESDPCQFWARNADRFPSVAKLARKYLAIPATSVPSERVFSAAGNIVTARRNCLSPDNVNMLVFLCKNK